MDQDVAVNQRLCNNLEGWERVEGDSRGRGICVYLWLTHVDVWQKPKQYCKPTILQLKINKYFFKKRF